MEKDMCEVPEIDSTVDIAALEANGWERRAMTSRGQVFSNGRHKIVVTDDQTVYAAYSIGSSSAQDP